ncbi:ATP-grasp domain-containing protein [Staphylococcus epidermidis]|uniref:ATP-grasp domain-containing protein n=1 Tax=Staphylococcus epidermidis TaxID=1282 RepID=UPI0002994F36|nr:ATP-grasp domain-containing protein [Staphylococcus epidermidis]EKS26391.1 hypothetical protein HMPREF9281_02337 [Staphylococcus epidermidis BVS058A4]
MTILILSNTSGEKTPYSKWIKESEKKVVLFCPKNKKESFDLNKYLHIESFDNYLDDHTIISKALTLNTKYNFNHIISVSEFDVIRSAKLREVLNIPGQHYLSADAYRNKLFMKELLKNSSINVPEFSAVISRENVDEFIKLNDFPVVIKSIYGTGSQSTFIINKTKDVDDFFKYNNDQISNFEIEKFIDGDMFHVDGVILNNEIKYSFVSKYYTGCLEFKKNNPVSSYLLDNDNPLNQELKKQVREIINRLPKIDNSSFHVEFFVTKSNEIYFCEIASRTGGGEIGKSIEYASGILLNRETILNQLNEPTIVNRKTKNSTAFIMFPPQEGIYRGLAKKNSFSWIIDDQIFAEEGKCYSSAKFSADYIASVILEGENEHELMKRIDIVIEWYNKNMLWN